MFPMLPARMEPAPNVKIMYTKIMDWFLKSEGAN